MAATEFHHALLLEMQKFDLRTKINVAKDEIDIRDIESRAHSSRNSTTSMYSRESTVMLEQIVKTAREDELKTRQVKDDKILTVNNNRPVSKKKEEYNEKRSKREKNPFQEEISFAFKKAHEYTDKLLEWGKDENSRVRWSGCSTLACVIQDTGINNTENKENPQENKSETVPELKVTFGAEPPKELGLIHLANAGNHFCTL